VPTREAFREGDYEAINTRVALGGGQMPVEAATELLKGLEKTL
jgi:hypothetical protein